jgi:hypothetical protein
MFRNAKSFRIAGVAALVAAGALPAASASAHHTKPGVKLPSVSGLVQTGGPHDRSSSPASPQLSAPQVRVWRRPFVTGLTGRSGILGIKLSCTPYYGTGCDGEVKLGPGGLAGSGKYRTSSGLPQVVRVRLSRSAISQLLYRRQLNLRLTIQSADDLGNVASRTGRLTLNTR